MKRVKYYAPNWFNHRVIEPTGGGGGLLAGTIRLLTITLKWLYQAPPNLVTFCFYLLDTSGRILGKSIHQGVAAVVFEMRRLEKLNIRIFCFASNAEEGINLSQERCFQA